MSRVLLLLEEEIDARASAEWDCILYVPRAQPDHSMIDKLRNQPLPFLVWLNEAEHAAALAASECIRDASFAAVLGRVSELADAGRASDGSSEVQLDEKGRTLRIHQQSFVLTPTEFRFIKYLIDRNETWVPSAIAAQEVLGARLDYDSSLLRAHVLRIRRKLGSEGWRLQAARLRGVRWTGRAPRPELPANRYVSR
ncbi:MAG: winged helix-turn-helix domain-containing protein [Myxococcota bacterium]